MNELEKKEALGKLDVLMKCTPPGAWQLRDVATILRILVLDATAAEVPKDKAARNKRDR